MAALALETGVPVEQIQATLHKMQRRDRSKPIWVAVVLAGFIGYCVWIYERTLSIPTPVPAGVSIEEHIGSPIARMPAIQIPLESISQVTYGPDTGDLQVDPTFVPPHPLPPGIGLSVQVEKIVWGAGDPHATTLTGKLDDKELKNLHDDVLALLKYVRGRIGKCGLTPRASAGMADLSLAGPAYSATLQLNGYNGSSASGLSIPPLDKDLDADANRIFGNAADDTVDQFEGFQKQSQSWRTNTGPR